ncbi:hypothetical protein OIV83_004362 [Microbotryomycetes sp. JL201]|nr:hypothetical protein OIV83_004362 [Microbotryomycetes sp. JL201]
MTQLQYWSLQSMSPARQTNPNETSKSPPQQRRQTITGTGSLSQDSVAAVCLTPKQSRTNSAETWQTPPPRSDTPTPVSCPERPNTATVSTPEKKRAARSMQTVDLVAEYGTAESPWSSLRESSALLPPSRNELNTGSPSHTLDRLPPIADKPLKAINPSLQARFDSANCDVLDDKVKWSALWMTEFMLHGHPTWEQTHDLKWKHKGKQVEKLLDDKQRSLLKRSCNDDRKDPTTPKAKKARTEETRQVTEGPSWSTDLEAVRTLRSKMSDREQFVALVWIKDILPRPRSLSTTMTKKDCGEGVRQVRVQDVDMWIVGKEFPVSSVMVVGIIVGSDFSTRTGRSWYYVDDGTGVLQSSFTVPQPLPTYTFNRSHSNETPELSKQDDKVPMAATDDPLSNVFRVGTLVRVIGSVRPAENFRPVSVDAVKIGPSIASISNEPELTDEASCLIGSERMKEGFSAEADHHLRVAELHRTVYNRPFDLRNRLAEIQAQQTSSQASSTATESTMTSQALSTARRKVRFRRPAKLDIDDVTSHNFFAYIKQHLRNEFVDKVERPIDYHDQDRYKNFDLSLSTADLTKTENKIESYPVPFKLDELKRDKHLMMFATRLAQKNEFERRAKKQSVSTGQSVGPKNNVWISGRKEADGNDIVETKSVGSFGGSALLLASVGSVKQTDAGNGSSSFWTTKKRTATQDDQLLHGDKLTRAVDKLFEFAVQQMCKRGDIVLSARRPRMGRRAGDGFVSMATTVTGRSEAALPDEPSRSRATTFTSSRPLIEPDLLPTEPVRMPASLVKSPESVVRFDHKAGRYIHYRVQKEQEPERVACAQRWDYKMGRFVNVVQDDSAAVRLDGSELGHVQTAATLGFSQNTGRLSDTVVSARRTMGGGRRADKCDDRFDGYGHDSVRTRQGIHRDMSTMAATRHFDEWRPDELEPDVYELVTTTVLSHRLLNILNTQCHKPIHTTHNKPVEDDPGRTTSMSERSIRRSLYVDEQWQQVARFSSLVGTSLNDLVEDGKVVCRAVTNSVEPEFAPRWRG